MTQVKTNMTPKVLRLSAHQDQYYEAMLDLFSDAFEDPENYDSTRPSKDYRRTLLAREDFIALVALDDDTVVGALVAYELQKFEQERSEFYLYDLAVDEKSRQRGIATLLIHELKSIAKSKGSSVVYVQADHGDDPAVALYTKLGTREDVMHFDISFD